MPTTPAHSPTFLDRLVGRLDRLDPASVQTYLLRLVREKGFLETVFNTIHEGVVVIDRALKVQYCNAAARQFLAGGDDMTNRRIDRFLRDIDWRRLMAAESGEWRRVSLQEIEVFYPAHRHLTFYLVPYPGEGGDGVTGFPLAILLLHDTTQVHQDQQKTIESRKIEAITDLAAGVAHEIGNPLNSLTIHLQLLRRTLARQADPELAAEAGELLDVATQEVTRLDAIIHHFLRAVRPTPLNLAPVNLRELLTAALAFMSREIDDRHILVEATWPDTLPLVMGDADQLRQAFFNIIKNAIQAMPDGGALRVGVEERGAFLEVRFADTGRGIDPAVLPRILEPYFTTRQDGNGLGLMIVDRVIRGHGGELGIDSVSGRGTVFTVRLPLHTRQVRLLEQGRPADET